MSIRTCLKFPLLALALACFSSSAFAGDLVVSAASSLTNAFQKMARIYEAAHPDTHVVLNFASSDVLMRQIDNGAPADVYASADQVAMNNAEKHGLLLAGSRMNFLQNQLVLIVPSSSTLHLPDLKALEGAAVGRIAYGDPGSVPVGRYTQRVLQAAGVWNAVSRKGVLAQNVRQALDYVARDEVDAGFVYATDAAIMPTKVKVALRLPSPTPISYPMAIIASSAHTAEATSFQAFVMSARGQAVLGSFGFLKPNAATR